MSTRGTPHRWLHHNPTRRSWRSLGLVTVVLAALAQAVVVSGGPGTAAAAAPDIITVTKGEDYGFQGWGTSLAWWAKVIGNKAWRTPGAGGRSVRDEVLDALFRPADDNKHLGLNVIRYNIGASPTDQSKLGDKCPWVAPAKQIPLTKPGPNARVNLELDADQIATLRDARDILSNAHQQGVFEAFANSPPWWLTNNHCVTGKWKGSTTMDVLDTQANVDDYISYLIDVIDAFQHDPKPIDFDWLEPFNEPGFDNKARDMPWGNCTSGECQEGAHFSRAMQEAVVAGLCRRLRERNLPTPKISAPDGNSPDETVEAFKAYGPFAKACVLQLNTHSYSGQKPYEGDRRKEVAAQASGGRQVWMSEFGNGTTNGIRPEIDIKAGLTLADQIATDMKFLRPTAWVYWQAVENASVWGLLDIEKFYDNSGKKITYGKRFYALEQYSRFIRPGYRIISANDPTRDSANPKEKATTVAAVSPDARRIVVVATNNDNNERIPNYDLSSLGVDTGDIHVYRTDEKTNNVDLQPVTRQMFNGRFLDLQPPQTITTYVVDLPNPVPGFPSTGTPPSTQLTYTGPTIADYHDTFTASATLTAGGSPVSSAPVTFTLGSGGGTQTCTSTTNSSGSASCALTPDQTAGPTTLTVSFAGIGAFPPTSTSVSFAITPEETTVAYVGPTHVANGVPANLSGVLKEDGTVPIAGRAMTISLGSGASQQTCSGTTDSTGTATCTITSVDQPLNDTATVPVTVSFTGDPYYLPSTASATVRLEYYTGRAFGLSAAVNLPLITVTVPPTPDTGPVRVANASSTTTPCTASVSAIVINATALCPNVTTRLAPGTSTATSTVADVTINIPGVPVIEISGITATSTSTCGSATGSTALLTLRIAGTPVTVPTQPNSKINLLAAQLIINEQTPVAGADYGLIVYAVHLTVPGGVGDIVVGSTTSDVHNCR